MLETISMNEVTSSNINRIGYSKEHQALRIEFKSGGIYRYIGLRETEWLKITQANSLGSAIHKLVLANENLVVIKEDEMDISSLFQQLKGLKMLMAMGKSPTKKQLKGLLDKSGIVLPKQKATAVKK